MFRSPKALELQQTRVIITPLLITSFFNHHDAIHSRIRHHCVYLFTVFGPGASVETTQSCTKLGAERRMENDRRPVPLRERILLQAEWKYNNSVPCNRKWATERDENSAVTSVHTAWFISSFESS